MSKEVSVYRSYIIPFEGKYVRKVTDDDKRFWEELIKVDLRNFLKNSLDIAKSAGEGIGRVERLELVADLITFFFKAPLTADPLLSLAPSPPKLYLVLRRWKKLLEPFYEDPVEYLNTLVKQVDIDAYIDEGLREKVKRAWLIFPADTRPGANTSSLIAHLLTASSIAWSLAFNSSKDREYLAIQRLSSQLHDIAKPIEPREHYRVEVFGGLVKALLGEILSAKDVEGIVETVKRHHLDEESPVRMADQISAATDRVRDIVRSLIGEEFNAPDFKEIAPGSKEGVFELAYGGGKDAWDFWASIEERMPGKIEELSEKFIDRLSVAPRINVELRPLDKLRYFLIDVGEVQRFVYRSSKLSAVAVASLYIDYLTSFIIPLYIQAWFERKKDVWLPLESFLTTSGANISGILPGSVEKSMFREGIEELRKRLGPLEVDLRVAVTSFYQYYPHMWDEVNKEMALEKIVPRPLEDESDFSPGIEPSRLCTLCYRKEATHIKAVGELCDTCNKLVELGAVLGFKARWGSGFMLGREKIVPKDIWGAEYGDESNPYSIASNVMELISGMDPPFEGRELNVGIIKGDGNMMGKFFSESISISDALERSFRLDQSLKTAYERALRAMLSANGVDNARKKDVCRVWLGTIYIGGDDFLIIAPSWLSLPLSYVLGKEFESSMGGKCTLSIGIAAVPPKHSIWHAIGAAAEIMESAKRDVGRSQTSAISFDVVEQGLLTEEMAWKRLGILRSNGLTARPMPLEGRSTFSMKDLLSFFGYPLDYYDADRIMAYACNHSPSQGERENSVVTLLRLSRKAARDAMESVASMLGGWDERRRVLALQIATIYCYRESKDESREEELRNVFKALAELFRRQLTDEATKRKEAIPLLDIDASAKILGGGKI